MWYILMTIGLYICVPIIRYVVNNASDKIVGYWIIIMFVFVSVIPFFSELKIYYLSNVVAQLTKYMEMYFLLGYTLYFVLGYYLFTKNLSVRIKRIIYSIGIISLLVTFIWKVFINSDVAILTYLHPNIVLFSLAVMLFFKEKINLNSISYLLKKVIVTLSKLTYGIFLIHVLVLKVLYHCGINLSILPAYFSIPLISLVVFIVSGIVIFVISKIPYINKYIC